MGIGIHRGKMIAGNMGADNRLNYTVIGANVNMAFRFCSEAKPMQVLISETVYSMPEVKEAIEVVSTKELELKGFTEKVKAYEVKI